MSVQVTIDPRAYSLLHRIKDVPGAMRVAATAMDRENQFTVGHIQQKYLSFPKTGPTQAIGLRVQSNRLRGSLRATKAIATADTVKSSIGSNVKYAAIHEFGGKTAPHVIRPKNGKALKFGGKYFARVNHPGSVMPARGFVQRGLEDRARDYSQSIGTAIVKFWEGER